MRLRTNVLLLAVFAGIAACGSSSGNSATVGSIRVSDTTTAAQQNSVIDPDGYSVTVDGANAQALPAIGGLVVFGNLPLGSHTVSLTGLAGNCAVNPGTADVVTTLDGTFPNRAVGYTVVCQ